MGLVTSMLNDRIKLKPFIGRNPKGGDAVYGPEESVPAFVQHRIKTIKDANGEERMSGTMIITEHPVKLGDLISFDATDEKPRAILTVSVCRGLYGKVDHYEAWLQWQNM